MLPRIFSQMSQNKMMVSFLGLALIIAMAGCGGGGGGEPGVAGGSNVTVTGKVDDGTPNSPISDAACFFDDLTGEVLAETTADENGNYSIEIPPGKEGFIRCHPVELPKLALYTFFSTERRAAGDVVNHEHVTPATTIVADIIASENSTSSERLKAEKLDSINKRTFVVLHASHLYKTMLRRHYNIQFGGYDGGGKNGGGGGGGGSGAGGAAGDGGDRSPIANARCEFITGADLEEGPVLYNAVLADFLDDGILNRPDLKLVAEDLSKAVQEYAPGEIDKAFIQEAFKRVLSSGIGTPYETITDENGKYFIPIPPGIPGFVRCFPPDQERLVLGTYVPALQEDEILLGQDVNPPTTVFSKIIAPKISGDLGAAKAKFMKDIDNLDVEILYNNTTVSGFQLKDQKEPENKDVGTMAFAATSYFNVLYKNGEDADFLAVLDDLSELQEVDLGIGVPADKAATYRSIADNSIIKTGKILYVSNLPGGGGGAGGAAGDGGDDSEPTAISFLKLASSTRRINVTVTDVPGGKGIDGVEIDISNLPSGASLKNDLPVVTDEDGKVTLTFSDVPAGDTEVEITALAYGYVEVNATIQMVALATVDFELAMDTAVPKVTITSPTSRPSHTSYSSKFTIGGTASDDVGINQVAWSNDRGGSGICVGTSDWSTSEIQLSQGTNVITIFAQDTDDNVGISTLTVTYVLRVIVPLDPGVFKPRLQPVVPTVAITSPVPDSTYTTYYSTLNISGTASDDKGISQVTWSNDRGGSDTCLTTKLETGDISIGWTASEIPLSFGINVITITAQDTNGNVGSSTLTVDKQLLKLKDPIFTYPLLPVLTKPILRFP